MSRTERCEGSKEVPQRWEVRCGARPSGGDAPMHPLPRDVHRSAAEVGKGYRERRRGRVSGARVADGYEESLTHPSPRRCGARVSGSVRGDRDEEGEGHRNCLHPQ